MWSFARPCRDYQQDLEAQLAMKSTPMSVSKLQMYQDHVQTHLDAKAGRTFAESDASIEEAEERLLEAEYAMMVSGLQADYRLHVQHQNAKNRVEANSHYVRVMHLKEQIADCNVKIETFMSKRCLVKCLSETLPRLYIQTSGGPRILLPFQLSVRKQV